MKFKQLFLFVLFIAVIAITACATKKRGQVPCPAFTKKANTAEIVQMRG